MICQSQEELSHHYTPQLIEFAALGIEYAGVVENLPSRRGFLVQLLTILPRLYACALSLPAYLYSPEEDYIEEYITEVSYDRVRRGIEDLLGEDDRFLSAMEADMVYSDVPLSVALSEYLADVYQQVGNLLGILKERNEIALPAAIGRCRLYWREYWGAHLLSSLQALHQLYAAEELATDSLEEEPTDEV